MVQSDEPYNLREYEGCFGEYVCLIGLWEATEASEDYPHRFVYMRSSLFSQAINTEPCFNDVHNDEGFPHLPTAHVLGAL